MGRKKIVKGGVIWVNLPEDQVQIFTEDQKKIYIGAINNNNFNSLRSFILNYLNNTNQQQFINKINAYLNLIRSEKLTSLKKFLKNFSYSNLEKIKSIVESESIKSIIDEVLREKNETDKVLQEGTAQTAGKRKPLTTCTVAELKAKAKKRGIKVTGLKKAEIIAKLRRR